MTDPRSACPPNRTWLTTYLTVQDPQQALNFYTKVLGFTPREVIREKVTDRILFALITYQGFNLMFGPDVAFDGRSGSLSPNLSQTHSPIVLYLYTDRLDAIYAMCKDMKISIIRDMHTTFWGDKVFKIKDPEGYFWDIATNFADPDAQKSSSKVYYELELGKK